MTKPTRNLDERSFVQRHATLAGIALVLSYGLFAGGALGLIAAAVILLALAVAFSVIVTCLQALKPFDLQSSLSTSGGRICSPMPFHRRLWRNFVIALTDVPSVWG